MAEPETISAKPIGENENGNSNPSAVNRLRDKAKALKTPRGKYRCRKCRELPCVCKDPKQSTPGPDARPTQSAPPDSGPRVELFTEKNSKRLLEAAFGIPTVLTNCKIWALTEDEALELCKPTANVLNEFVTVDPKWVALSILSVSLGSIMARKAVLYSAWKRAMAAQTIGAIHDTRAEPPPPYRATGDTQEGEGEPHANGSGPKGPGPSVNMDMLQ